MSDQIQRLAEATGDAWTTAKVEAWNAAIEAAAQACISRKVDSLGVYGDARNRCCEDNAAAVRALKRP